MKSALIAEISLPMKVPSVFFFHWVFPLGELQNYRMTDLCIVRSLCEVIKGRQFRLSAGDDQPTACNLR